jgi:putative sigma-54 modulation protein
MNINIKATGIELTDAIRQYAEKKISSVEKYTDKKAGVTAHIEVGKTTNHHKGGDVFRAEVRMVGNGLNLYAVSEASDLYAAIDLVENEAARELVSMKGRHIRLLRQGERAVKYMMKGLSYPWRRRNR